MDGDVPSVGGGLNPPDQLDIWPRVAMSTYESNQAFPSGNCRGMGAASSSTADAREAPQPEAARLEEAKRTELTQTTDEVTARMASFVVPIVEHEESQVSRPSILQLPIILSSDSEDIDMEASDGYIGAHGP